MKGFKTVETKQEFKDFVRVPNVLHANDTQFIAQLGFEREEHLSEENPYFQHANHQYFIAYDNSQPIGRISAQIDRLTQKERSPTIGHFGLIEADNTQTLKCLLSIAENWLKDQGAEIAQGPYSLSINDEAGLLVKGFDTAPYMMMNHAPKWYSQTLEEAGYKKAKDLIAYHMKLDTDIPGSFAYMARQAENDPAISERAINMKNFDAELTTILEIFNDAWANNWGFVPMTNEEVAYTAQNMKLLIKPSMVHIAFIDDKPVAMIVALPNLNEALTGLKGKLMPFGWAKLLWRLKLRGLKTARVLLIGVRKEYQSTPIAGALSALLMRNIYNAARSENMTELEMSWILEDNEPMKRLIQAIGGDPYKHYRIYEKTLTLNSESAL